MEEVKEVEEKSLEEVLIEECSKVIKEMEDIKWRLRRKETIDKIYEEGKITKEDYDDSMYAIKKDYSTVPLGALDIMDERSKESE